MDIKISTKDYSGELLNKLEKNIEAALQGMGTEAVAIIGDGMDTIYGKPIWDTGDLHRDVDYQVREGDREVDVGNSLDYAIKVHEGTSRMAARPYIRDSLLTEYAQDRLQKIAAQELKRGIK